jgi:5-methylcytosine-specific restriction endonuclease McrA
MSKGGGKYCGQECFNLNRRKRRTYNCVLCGAERTVKAGQSNRYCSTSCHYMDGKLTEDQMIERRRLAGRKRRARMAAVECEPYTLSEIAERDGWRCQLCGKKVQQQVARKGRPDRLSPSVDHIVPISLGGHDVKANVQLAHLGCNAKKSNRTLPRGEQLRLIG